jgi:hypothetical protein
MQQKSSQAEQVGENVTKAPASEGGHYKRKEHRLKPVLPKLAFEEVFVGV